MEGKWRKYKTKEEIVEAYQIKKGGFMQVTVGEMMISPGMYVVKKQNSETLIMTWKDFERKYELME